MKIIARWLRYLRYLLDVLTEDNTTATVSTMTGSFRVSDLGK